MRLIAGFALLIIGGVLALPGVPGPGIPIILLGLLLLSDHFAWARRALVVVTGKNCWGPAKDRVRGDGNGQRRALTGVKKRTPLMTISTYGNTRVIPEPFGKSVPLIRRLLVDAGLSVVEEFDVSGAPYFQLGNRPALLRRARWWILPVLLFEAIALDRAAAVFLPVHVVISGDRDTSYVHWANPMTSSNLRPPAPSKGALEDLCSRVIQGAVGTPSDCGSRRAIT